MDELWQRHKIFIVQCSIGAIVLLISWAVHSSIYDDIEVQQRNNQLRKTQLEKQLADGLAPSASSIREQQAAAKAGQEQIESMARMVASVAPLGSNRVEYVRESVSWLLTSIGKADQVDKYVGLYETLPQTCLFQLKEEARTVLASQAAQLGRDLDETLGIKNSFADSEVAVGIHGLAIMVDIIKRGLAISVPITVESGEGVIESFSELNISVRNRRSKMNAGMESEVVSFPVRMTVRGDPAAILKLLLTFNSTGNPVQRMTVVESIQGGERERADTDEVRVTFHLLGLHHIGVATSLEETAK